MGRTNRCAAGWAVAVLLALTGAAHAEAPETGELVVTQTRTAEPVSRVPANISVVTGEDLRARGADHLREALALVAGVEAPSGGDAGPASAVLSLWGLHEFDAFLLVVDGVPWGGAYNPSIETLDLSGVERIEVLRGAAPVMYGATSFVGVIQVIHYPAGSREANGAEGGGGSFGSWRADGSIALPAQGGFGHSLVVDAAGERFADPREKVDNVHALYRAGADLAGGRVRFDLDLSVLRSVPPSPLVRSEAAFITPLDMNLNPSDARIDEDRYHGVIGYVREGHGLTWTATASLAWSRIADVRGFVRPDLSAADSQNQRRHIEDDYFDTNLDLELPSDSHLIVGADLLYGHATQASANGEYEPAPPGETQPATSSLPIDEVNRLGDVRVFAGQYAQLDLRPAEGWDILGGLRLNETYEHKLSTHIDNADPTADTFDDRTRRVTRLSGMAGVSYRLWASGADQVTAYADYRNTFKPSAIDFGPDNTPDILKPELAKSYEAGLKGRLAHGRLDFSASVFRLDFTNLVVATTDEMGDPILENAGGERLKGVEAEARWRASEALSFSLAASWHDAHFTHYVATEGGENIDVSGNRLTLSPQWLWSAGVVYAPRQGLFGSLTLSYVGPRFLDLANEARTGAYLMLDAGVGWRRGRWRLSVNGYNLADQRRPVSQSEFGDQSFYVSPPRRVLVQLGVDF
jgi:outer membrane receptor protein involved in Fe transport